MKITEQSKGTILKDMQLARMSIAKALESVLNVLRAPAEQTNPVMLAIASKYLLGSVDHLGTLYGGALWLATVDRNMVDGAADSDKVKADLLVHLAKRAVSVGQAEVTVGPGFPAIPQSPQQAYYNTVVIQSIAEAVACLDEAQKSHDETVERCTRCGISFDLLNDGDPETEMLYKRAWAADHGIEVDESGDPLPGQEDKLMAALNPEAANAQATMGGLLGALLGGLAQGGSVQAEEPQVDTGALFGSLGSGERIEPRVPRRSNAGDVRITG